MEDARGACAYLAKAAAALTALSLLPVALSGSAPSHAPDVLLPISAQAAGDSAPIGPSTDPGVEWSTTLFASFTYDGLEAQGLYSHFWYNEMTGGTINSLFVKGAGPSVLYVSFLRIDGFIAVDRPLTDGPIFRARGYLVEIVAHDDPTALLEIRTAGIARDVRIELPPVATDLSHQSAPTSWPASVLSFRVGNEQAHLILGSGSFEVSNRTILARMQRSDLLLFKAVPVYSPHKTEWRAILDAIASGVVIAEMDFVALPSGGWVENSARYRIDVLTVSMNVEPRRASIIVQSPRAGGGVVLLGFDSETMPVANNTLIVRVDGRDADRTEDTLELFYAHAEPVYRPLFSLLPLPATVLAVYVPTLSSVSVEVESVSPPPPTPYWDLSSQLAMVAALALVSFAAAVMFRRKLR